MSLASILGRPWIKGIAQAVAEEVQRKERNREEQPRVDEQPGKFLHAVRAFLDEDTPGTHGRLEAQPEETEESLGQRHARDRQRGVVDDWRQRVWDHVAKNDPHLGKPERLGGFDEFLVAQRLDLAA